MKLYLVRHGHKIGQELDSGIIDADLSSTGIEQSKRVGMLFRAANREIKIDHIYCSELRRAKQTLAEILHFLSNNPVNNHLLNNPVVTYTKDINEASRGIYTRRGDYIAALRASGLKEHQFRPEMGENYFDVEQRAQKFWDFLLEKHNADTVLCVGHGIFFRLLILRSLRLHMREMAYFGLSNAGISFLEAVDGNVINMSLDSTTHLVENSSYGREKQQGLTQ